MASANWQRFKNAKSRERVTDSRAIQDDLQDPTLLPDNAYYQEHLWPIPGARP